MRANWKLEKIATRAHDFCRWRCSWLTAAGLLLAVAPVQAQPEGDPAPEAAAGEADGGEDVHAVDAIVVTGSRTERPLGETPVATEVINASLVDDDYQLENPPVQVDA